MQTAHSVTEGMVAFSRWGLESRIHQAPDQMPLEMQQHTGSIWFQSLMTNF